jgi:hypothetical protein
MTTTSDLQRKVDIAMERGSDGIYDYVIDENGDFLGEEGFDTSILQDVFSELRADDRRGSTVNEFPTTVGWKIGSKVWFYDQARATLDTKNGAADALRTSLNKYVPRYLQEVIVTGILNGKVDKKYFDLWDRTGKNI